MRTRNRQEQIQLEHAIWGAWDGETLVGYAHSRALRESWHLNYLAVLPTHQGQGIGRALWAKWILLGQRQGYQLLTLDVSAKNRRALEWYQRHGFTVREKTWIYVRELLMPDKHSGSRLAVVLRDWEHAEASQSVYGFSRFILVYAEQEWPVGRLGDLFFRVDPRFPATLEGVLAEIDPARLLLFSSSHPLCDATHRRVMLSYRMARQSG